MKLIIVTKSPKDLPQDIDEVVCAFWPEAGLHVNPRFVDSDQRGWYEENVRAVEECGFTTAEAECDSMVIVNASKSINGSTKESAAIPLWILAEMHSYQSSYLFFLLDRRLDQPTPEESTRTEIYRFDVKKGELVPLPRPNQSVWPAILSIIKLSLKETSAAPA